MLKFLRGSMAAVAIWAVAGSPTPVVAQAAPVPPPTPAPATAQPQQEYRAKQILGTKVHIQGNIAIGTVDDIVFADDGQLEYLLVLNDGKYVSLPWRAATFNFTDQTAAVNITQEQYRVIPTFGLRAYPRFFAPEYRVEIYKYYGLTPHERRVERREERRP
jgi:hypothetical protein